MKKDLEIRYFTHDEIDPAKWDACISASPNGMIYAQSFYLDAMAKHWDALVLNDYEIVMPLTWNKKYGIAYLYQPSFTPSLGIFGKDITEDLIENFVRSIPKKFKLIEIALNAGNMFTWRSGFSTLHNNYTLSLKKEYAALYASYNEQTRRNIKKAAQAGCTIKKDIPLSDVIALSKLAMQQVTNVKDKDYENFENLFALLHNKNEAIVYGVYSPANELMASSAFFFSHHRAYYILVGNHPEGKKIGASHFLIDRFISDHANEDLLLDFEGSDIPGVAAFYTSFGATFETYPFLKVNRLPFLLKWLK